MYGANDSDGSRTAAYMKNLEARLGTNVGAKYDELMKTG
jgi:hypothetical protein